MLWLISLQPYGHSLTDPLANITLPNIRIERTLLKLKLEPIQEWVGLWRVACDDQLRSCCLVDGIRALGWRREVEGLGVS